jgi:DsbC/DsbD-like thiol-disulfide interchange protein
MTVMQRVSVAVLALCAGAALGANTAKETAHLTVKTTHSAAAAAPGGKVSLFVDVTPKPKMHVYAPGQDGYIAINLTLDANPAFTAAKAKYPAGEKQRIEILNETQLVYAKPFRIAQDVTLASTPELRQRAASDAPLTIKGTVRYQACDDKICYLPTNVPVEWEVKLTPR